MKGPAIGAPSLPFEMLKRSIGKRDGYRNVIGKVSVRDGEGCDVTKGPFLSGPSFCFATRLACDVIFPRATLKISFGNY